MVQPVHTVPKDAKLLAVLLSALDIEEYEDNIIHLLLQFVHSYSTRVLHEALLLAHHAQRSALEVSDVVLAISQASLFVCQHHFLKDHCLVLFQSARRPDPRAHDCRAEQASAAHYPRSLWNPCAARTYLVLFIYPNK